MQKRYDVTKIIHLLNIYKVKKKPAVAYNLSGDYRALPMPSGLAKHVSCEV